MGSHISQAGSLVESNKLRFDFTHHKALSKEELESIEKRVNEMIISSSEAILENMPLEDAKKVELLLYLMKNIKVMYAF